MLGDFTRSVSHCIEAFSYIFKPWAFKYFFISGLISLMTFAACAGSIYFFGDDLANGIIHLFTEKLSWDWLTKVIEWLVRLLLFAVAFFILKYIVLIVNSPIMSLLSEKVEEKITGHKTPSLSIKQQFKGLSRGLRLSLSNLMRELFWVLIIFLVSLIPGAAFITSILFFLVGAYYAGFGNIDFFMERRFTIKQSRHFVKRNKGMAIGNGSVFLLLFLIPVLGAFVAPTISTIGATLSGLSKLNEVEELAYS